MMTGSARVRGCGAPLPRQRVPLRPGSIQSRTTRSGSTRVDGGLRLLGIGGDA